jgi:hypothetical protein
LFANTIYYPRFRRELAELRPKPGNEKYAVVAGAVAGGGLTVIANANPAGQAILVSQFGDEGISAMKLFIWAILPTLIMGAAFMLLR